MALGMVLGKVAGTGWVMHKDEHLIGLKQRLKLDYSLKRGMLAVGDRIEVAQL